MKSRQEFRIKGQDKVKGCDPLERVKRVVEVLEYNKPQLLTLKMGAQLATGEIIQMPSVVKTDGIRRRKVAVWGDAIHVTNLEIEITHAFLFTKDNRLVSKREFSFTPNSGEILQMRIMLTL